MVDVLTSASESHQQIWSKMFGIFRAGQNVYGILLYEVPRKRGPHIITIYKTTTIIQNKEFSESHPRETRAG